MKIAEDIFRIDNVKGANSYLVKVKDGLILIDSGMPGNAQTILEFIKNMKLKQHRLLYIILTHADIDHIGSVSEIKKQTHAKIAIGKDDALVLAGKKDGKKAKGLLGVIFKIFSVFMKVEHVKPDISLRDGDKIEGFEVIRVPGHTPGSISLYRSKDGVIFSGDALLGDRAGNPKDPRKALSSNYSQALKSAKKIKSLKYKLLLPGHGKPVRPA